ncbi:hypothetical protein PVK06_001522 [Gossypium arboreum]|uniref:Uncharacterized protein n=1 Tax=Gossypium arboreum TaxID=29729 RepID=A0ABR0R176_GOSAR|nr:hypothetical protein PVK06_001522 [Gossypium arboreum]
MGTNADGEEGSSNDDHSHHNGEDFSDLDLDEVLDDIENKGVKEDPNVALTPEFSKYPDIILVFWLAANSEFEGLFVGKQFENKADCVFPSSSTT